MSDFIIVSQAQKKEEPLSYLCEHRVPFPKAVWFIKISAAHAIQLQETNKSKKRQVRLVMI